MLTFASVARFKKKKREKTNNIIDSKMDGFIFAGHTAPPALTKETVFDTLAQTTKKEALRIQTLPQHFNGTTTNPEWLKARTVVPGIKRITGSMVANCGHHAYKQKKKLPEACKEIALWSFLWDDFKGNIATGYGNHFEDTCEETFKEEYALDLHLTNQPVTFDIANPGLCIDWEGPWAGYSPDGIITEQWEDGSTTINLMEYKCPYGKRNVSYQYKKPLYGPTRCPLPPLTSKISHNITPYYYDQIQYGMGLLHKMGMLKPGKEGLYTYFCCWTPELFTYEKIPFDREYFDWLYAEAKAFWHDQYLPLAVAKINGELREGETSLALQL